MTREELTAAVLEADAAVKVTGEAVTAKRAEPGGDPWTSDGKKYKNDLRNLTGRWTYAIGDRARLLAEAAQVGLIPFYGAGDGSITTLETYDERDERKNAVLRASLARQAEARLAKGTA